MSVSADDGKQWYSYIEDHLADDQGEDAESVVQGRVDSHSDKTSDLDTSSRIACLSSMCQSGGNLACHSSMSFPSPCISNCSCKKSYSLASSTLSLSSPSLSNSSVDSSLSSSLSSSLPALNHGNIRSCLPCGSISSVSKVSRKSQSDDCSNRCDILARTKQVCDETPCPSHLAQPAVPSGCFMRKARSSQDLRTTLESKEGTSTDLVYDICPQSHQHGIVGSVSEEQFGGLGVAESQAFQASNSSDMECLEARESFSIENSCDNFSDGSQGSSCNIAIYTSSYTQSPGSNDFHHINFKSSLLSGSLPCGLSADQDSPSLSLCLERCDQDCVTSSGSSLLDSSDHYILVPREDLPVMDATCGNISSQLRLRCVSTLSSLHIPATPESVPDMQKFSSRASTLVRNQESFTCASFSDASPSRFTSKKARLEYSGSLSVSVDYALRQLDLGVEVNTYDKTEDFTDCLSADLLDSFCVNDNACDASSKLSLKRKSCK